MESGPITVQTTGTIASHNSGNLSETKTTENNICLYVDYIENVYSVLCFLLKTSLFGAILQMWLCVILSRDNIAVSTSWVKWVHTLLFFFWCHAV